MKRFSGGQAVRSKPTPVRRTCPRPHLVSTTAPSAEARHQTENEKQCTFDIDDALPQTLPPSQKELEHIPEHIVVDCCIL